MTVNRGHGQEPCECGDSLAKWTGVEYSYDMPEHYDGVSEWVCQFCGNRYGRWSGKLLKQGELEKPFGGEQ